MILRFFSSKFWIPFQFDVHSLVNTLCSPNLEGLCFDAKQSPIRDKIVSVALSNHQLQLWDCRGFSKCSTLFHGCEVITVDWHNTNENFVITGSSDGILRLWDLRKSGTPVKRFIGHEWAIRQVTSCKFNADIFLTCSYDKTVRRWNIQNENVHHILQHHTEFVYGIDTNPIIKGLAIDCSWDSQIKLFKY